MLEDADPSNERGGRITVGHEVRKLALVSDNRAFNRLYELVGHAELNERAWEMGLDSTRITHRLSEFRGYEDQLRTPLVVALTEEGPRLFSERTSAVRLDNEGLGGLAIGEAHMSAGEHVDEPMDFTRKNRISLVDLQDMLIALARPDLDCGATVELSEESRAFLLAAMSEAPCESPNPVYDRERYPDDYCKFFLPGLSRVIPRESLRVAGKCGRAYGFTVDNAWITDLRTGTQLFLTAVVYTNPNGTLNDNVYGYEELADPLFADLAEAAARWLAE